MPHWMGTWPRERVRLEFTAVLAILIRMRHTSRKRQSPDPLAPVHEPAWLVVRDAHGIIIESSELQPNCNLRTVLTAARRDRIAEGWTAAEIGSHCAFFFASRDGERVLVGIERRAPHSRGTCYLDR